MSIRFLTFMMTGALLLLAGCSPRGVGNEQSPKQTPAPSERVVNLMGGWSQAKAITETGTATAYRIKNPNAPREEEKLGPGVSLTKEQRQSLVKMLAQDEHYLWDVAKGCAPQYGVLVAFKHDTTNANVRFCYKCQMLEYNPGSGEDFDPINEKLIEWVQGVFPDDETIQKLGEPTED